MPRTGRSAPGDDGWRLRRLARRLSDSVTALAAASLLLWSLPGLLLRDVMGEFIRPAAALGLLLCGISLRLYAWDRRRAGRAVCCQLSCALVGSFALFCWLAFHALLPGPVCGLMADCGFGAELMPVGGACLLLSTAVAIGSLAQGNRGGLGQELFVLCLPNLFVCGIMLLGYVLEDHSLPGVRATPFIYPGASLGFLLLNAAIFLERPENRYLRVFLDRRSGAQLARQLFLGMSTAALPLGLLRLYLQKSGWLSMGQAVAFLLISLLDVFILALWRVVKDLNKQEESAQRLHSAIVSQNHAQQDLQQRLEAEKMLTAGLLRATRDCSVIATDTAGVVTLCNEGAVKMLGYAAADVVGAPGAGAAGVPTLPVLERLAHSPGAKAHPWTIVRPDASQLTVSLRVEGLVDAQHTLHGYVCIARPL